MGLVVQANGGRFVWGSKLQSATAQSTAKAEFTALDTVMRKKTSFCHVLGKIVTPMEEHTALLQGNLGRISWTQGV